MRTSARHMGCSAAAFVAVAFTAAIAIPPPASAQAANVQAQIDCFGVAPQRLTPDATSGKTLRSSALRRRQTRRVSKSPRSTPSHDSRSARDFCCVFFLAGRNSRGVTSPRRTCQPASVSCNTLYSPVLARNSWPINWSIQPRAVRLSCWARIPHVLSRSWPRRSMRSSLEPTSTWAT